MSTDQPPPSRRQLRARGTSTGRPLALAPDGLPPRHLRSCDPAYWYAMVDVDGVDAPAGDVVEHWRRAGSHLSPPRLEVHLQECEALHVATLARHRWAAAADAWAAEHGIDRRTPAGRAKFQALCDRADALDAATTTPGGTTAQP